MRLNKQQKEGSKKTLDDLEEFIYSGLKNDPLFRKKTLLYMYCELELNSVGIWGWLSKKKHISPRYQKVINEYLNSKK